MRRPPRRSHCASWRKRNGFRPLWEVNVFYSLHALNLALYWKFLEGEMREEWREIEGGMEGNGGKWRERGGNRGKWGEWGKMKGKWPLFEMFTVNSIAKCFPGLPKYGVRVAPLRNKVVLFIFIRGLYLLWVYQGDGFGWWPKGPRFDPWSDEFWLCLRSNSSLSFSLSVMILTLSSTARGSNST